MPEPFACCSKMDRGRLPEITMISGDKVLLLYSRLFYFSPLLFSSSRFGPSYDRQRIISSFSKFHFTHVKNYYLFAERFVDFTLLLQLISFLLTF